MKTPVVAFLFVLLNAVSGAEVPRVFSEKAFTAKDLAEADSGPQIAPPFQGSNNFSALTRGCAPSSLAPGFDAPPRWGFF